MLVREGNLLVYRIFDVGWEVDLEDLSQRISGKRGRRFSKIGPRSVVMGEHPIEMFLSRGRVGDVPYESYARVYGLGVVTIILRFDISGRRIEKIPSLERYLDKHVDSLVSGLLKEVMDTIRPFVERPALFQDYEDYTVIFIKAFEERLPSREVLSRVDVSRLIFGENYELSSDIKRWLAMNTFSYSTYDVAVLGWDHAFVYDDEGFMDIPDLIEFANIQLLELRYFDDYLDSVVQDTSSELENFRPSIRRYRKYSRMIQKLLLIYTEITQARERVLNFIKFMEDNFLARVYNRLAYILGLNVWSSSVENKLESLLRIYEMLSNEINNQRFQLLELTIIFLILLEVILYLVELL